MFFYIILVAIGLFFAKLFRSVWISNYKSKYVFITGCDSGFGQELALKLDQLECRVFAGCLTEKGETELKKLSSERLITIPLDVTKQDSLDKALEKVESIIPKNEGLWAIVNNAGILGPTGMLEWLGVDDYWSTLNVNFLGIVRTNLTFTSLVKKAKGRIVNIISIFGRFSGNGMPYIVSKFAAEAYTDGFRREMRSFDVSVHTIEPGFFTTSLTAKENLINSVKNSWNNAPISIKNEYGENYLEKVFPKISQLKTSKKTYQVVDAIIHALFSKFPKIRYVVGLDGHYIFIPLSWLPDWLSDFLFINVLKGMKFSK